MSFSDFLTLKVSDLMQKNVVTVAEDETIQGAAQFMSERKIGAVVVLDPVNQSVVGILTERDLMTRVVAKALDAKVMLVREIMTRSVATLTSSLPAAEVFSLLQSRNFRHVPIVDRGKLVGMISIKDVFEIMHKVIGNVIFGEDK